MSANSDESIATRLELVRTQITDAELKFGRTPNSVTLLAVSKTFSAECVREAAAAGQVHFGESYVQEAVAKIEELASDPPELVWHYLGRLQSNKIKLVAQNFAWVQSITDLRHAELLSQHRPDNLPPLNVCIEVNASGETTKLGIVPDKTLVLARTVSSLPRLRLRGLMAIPAPCEDFAGQLKSFQCLHDLFTTLQIAGLEIDTLSAGMSGDFQAAIAAGSTMVRIGSSIFGARPPKNI